ncbi:phasin family protein [Comamonas piscis]|uniref:Phasin family protein n=1 Tax=Comamonas piscis TaxID=1562974 RepID=A0A7G5EJL9_9BURK|nr:phasin family protein [Comamonas piscis]QMV74194.1 phasin family protein [Comamonas piscis]WSO32636.1 phasin family protein [Comamonas piscis]
MALTPDQILAAHKANLETLMGLTHKAFEGVEKLVELNVAATRAALSDVSTNTSAVLDAKNAQDLMSVQSSLLQPMAEKTAAYSRHLYEIAASTSLEFSKAFENKAVEAQSKFNEFVDTASKNAPAGSESAVAVMKTAVAAANNAYDSVQKAVKQAGEVAETNFNTITNNAVNAAGTVSAAATAKRR